MHTHEANKFKKKMNCFLKNKEIEPQKSELKHQPFYLVDQMYNLKSFLTVFFLMKKKKRQKFLIKLSYEKIEFLMWQRYKKKTKKRKILM